MTDSVRRKIKQLRALAASTTFPEEAKSARAKADKLEQSLGGKRSWDSHAADAAAYAASEALRQYYHPRARPGHGGTNASYFSFDEASDISPELYAKFQEKLNEHMEKMMRGCWGFDPAAGGQ
jgi:hypothetical protein